MTKEELFKSLIDAKAKKGTAVAAVEEYLTAEGDGKTILPLFNGSLQNFFIECAAIFKDESSAFKAKARELEKSILVNDTTKFMARLAAMDDVNGNYYCRVFQQLIEDKPTPIKFPNGSLSYIAARTGRGKTTAMLSIAVDALVQGKQVYFMTNEESTHQIIMRLVKAFLYLNFAAIYPNTFEYNENEHRFNLLGNVGNLTTFITNTLKDSSKAESGTELQRLIWASFGHVCELLQAKQITIVDGLAEKNFEDVKRILSMIDAGAVVLNDYVQNTKRPDFKGGADYVPLKIVSRTFMEAALKNDYVIISGAQMNRTTADETNEEKGEPDKFSESALRECGDLEQDAFIHIQIGMQRMMDGQKDDLGNNVSRFYQILKNRDDGQDSTKYRILDLARFSLYNCMIDDTLRRFEKTKFEQSENYTKKQSTVKQKQFTPKENQSPLQQFSKAYGRGGR